MATTTRRTQTDGLVVVDKEPGWTSHDVVAKVRGIFGQRRVGHAGTLDPDATGVLLVGLGRCTRLLRFLQEGRKEYRGDVRFGIATSTLDAAGEILDRRPMPVSRDQVERAARAFVGEIEQVPPMVSAVKVGGRRLHELAREGKEVDREPRRVRIDRIQVEAFEPGEYPTATLRVECGAGTYIRSLAADLGTALGGCAHLANLRRTRAGSFGLDDARSLDEIRRDPAAAVLAPLEAMRDLEHLAVDAEQARAVTHGMTFPSTMAAASGLGDGPFAVVGPDARLLAVYERRRAAVAPVVVLAGNGG
ncbi:MAG TPA: tRNA pseudouridine(55) synthase TruB [Acidimicrobiia bacterium]|nr:tRNA pseudouridine(55) synthase TruB [Acidimicrobiia bacterium]